jgi:hypothetical protein
VEDSADLRFQVERSVRTYLELRRLILDPFLEANFGFHGTLRIFWQTARTDLLRHPLNFVLAIPFLLLSKIAGWFNKLGLYGPGKFAQRLPTRIPTGFEKVREQQIVSDLLGLGAEGNGLLHRLEEDGLREALNHFPRLRSCFQTEEIRKVIAAPLEDFSSTRFSILELASSGLTIAVAYLLFGNFSLSPLEIGRQLADSEARSNATSHFFLGPGAGNLFYAVFPPHPTVFQIAGWTAVVIVALGVLTMAINLIADPLQRWLGIHRRHLGKLLDECRDRVVLYSLEELNAFESAPWSPPKIAPLAPIAASERHPFTALGPSAKGVTLLEPRARTPALMSGGKVMLLPKELIERVAALAFQLEARLGRRRLVLSAAGVLIFLLLVGFWFYRRAGSYFEVQQLVEDKAYVTALSRLDSLEKKSRHEKEAEYWYWRGRALMGTKAFDPGIDAYRSAISRNLDYRKEPIVLRDAIDAVANKNNEKAKQLILQEIGPPAIDALLEKATSREDIQRWILVDLIRKLGAEDRIRYDKIAIADLAATSSCPAKKRAVEKVAEYRITAATGTLHELDGQPQFKCLQSSLKVALARLESPPGTP